MTFRTHYEYGTRDGSGLDEASLIQIGEQPAMRHYDLADRTRHRFVAQLDVAPRESLTFSVSGGVGTDDFDDSGLGLQESGFSNVSAGVDYQTPRGISVGGTYNFERYTGLQRSRSANPGEQETDPNRDWTVDSRENVHYFSIYVQPPRLGTRTEMRVSYDYSNATGNYVYEVGPALPPPSQLPAVYNKLQQFKFDLRHRLGAARPRRSPTPTNRSRSRLRVRSTVVDSIVQPSSLVLGYTYRPHDALGGVRYSTPGNEGDNMMRATTPFLFAVAAALSLMTPPPAVAQDAAKGEGVTTRRSAPSATPSPARATSRTRSTASAKLSADDIRAWIVDPIAMAAKASSTKTADAEEVGEPARGRPRRARGMQSLK